MIQVRIIGAERLSKLGAKAPGIKEGMRISLIQEMNQTAQRLILRAKQDYLSGPRPEILDVVTGRLRSSIYGRVRESGKTVTIAFGTDVPYAPIHEFGGRTRNGRMPRRPFLQPSVDEEKADFLDRVENILARAAEGFKSEQ